MNFLKELESIIDNRPKKRSVVSKKHAVIEAKKTDISPKAILANIISSTKGNQRPHVTSTAIISSLRTIVSKKLENEGIGVILASLNKFREANGMSATIPAYPDDYEIGAVYDHDDLVQTFGNRIPKEGLYYTDQKNFQGSSETFVVLVEAVKGNLDNDTISVEEGYQFLDKVKQELSDDEKNLTFIDYGTAKDEGYDFHASEDSDDEASHALVSDGYGYNADPPVKRGRGRPRKRLLDDDEAEEKQKVTRNSYFKQGDTEDDDVFVVNSRFPRNRVERDERDTREGIYYDFLRNSHKHRAKIMLFAKIPIVTGLKTKYAQKVISKVGRSTTTEPIAYSGHTYSKDAYMYLGTAKLVIGKEGYSKANLFPKFWFKPDKNFRYTWDEKLEPLVKKYEAARASDAEERKKVSKVSVTTHERRARKAEDSRIYRPETINDDWYDMIHQGQKHVDLINERDRRRKMEEEARVPEEVDELYGDRGPSDAELRAIENGESGYADDYGSDDINFANSYARSHGFGY